MKTILTTTILLLFFTFNSYSQESKVSVKQIINDAPELSKFPDSSYLLLKQNFRSIHDSVFIKKVFYPNKGLYYENKVKVKEDFSLSGMVEYNVLPSEVYKKNKPTVSIIGKITKKNFTSLLVRYYDVNSVRCYLMTFNKDFNLKSSVCFFAYNTVDPEDVYLSKDKCYFSPFIKSDLNEDTLHVFSKGFLDINYIFEIHQDGSINLVQKEQLDEK